MSEPEVTIQEIKDYLQSQGLSLKAWVVRVYEDANKQLCLETRVWIETRKRLKDVVIPAILLDDKLIGPEDLPFETTSTGENIKLVVDQTQETEPELYLSPNPKPPKKRSKRNKRYKPARKLKGQDLIKNQPGV
jgi:hypothetical protein